MTEDSLTSKFKSSPSSSIQAALYGAGLEEVSEQKQKDSLGVYVNLLQNKEGFTGYAGPSAARVWQSIQHENCFGGLDDTCVEKRVFYR